MAKQFRKATKRATENKGKAERISNRTVNKRKFTSDQQLKRATAKVVAISADGFQLRVSGTDYFLAFDNFPWFRYASDEDIKCISVFRNCDPENDGDFTVYWRLLDVHLPIKGIERHAKNPVKLPHPVFYPTIKGKLTNRIKDTSIEKQKYVVETEFTFKGRFTVVAESAEHAQKIVSERCRMQSGGAVVDVHVPFDEIAWDFDCSRADARVIKIKGDV